jgi:hypothetical protein
MRILMNPPRKTSTVVAKRLLLLFLIFLASIFLIKGTLAPSIAQSTERELDDQVPKHLPIKVKLKKEKEKAFKDLKNEKWVRDLELEVTNIGDKPIYLLHFTLVMPEIIGSSGLKSGFILHYGRSELGDIETKAEPEDIPIKPGETYVFKISEGQVLGWDSFRRRENMPQPKKVILHFGILSFGDGTGFLGNSGIPFPNEPKERSSLGRCRPEPYKSVPTMIDAQTEEIYIPRYQANQGILTPLSC